MHYVAGACFASSVMRTGISSLTAGTYFVTPKSERLITVVASKPAAWALNPGISNSRFFCYHEVAEEFAFVLYRLSNSSVQ